jgi:hypothetical protein
MQRHRPTGRVVVAGWQQGQNWQAASCAFLHSAMAGRLRCLRQGTA